MPAGLQEWMNEIRKEMQAGPGSRLAGLMKSLARGMALVTQGRLSIGV
jgi:hypothetical protein